MLSYKKCSRLHVDLASLIITVLAAILVTLCHMNLNVSLPLHTRSSLSLSFLPWEGQKGDVSMDQERLTFPLRGFTFLGFHLKTTAAQLKPFPIWRGEKRNPRKTSRKDGWLGLLALRVNFSLQYQSTLVDRWTCCSPTAHCAKWEHTSFSMKNYTMVEHLSLICAVGIKIILHCFGS